MTRQQAQVERAARKLQNEVWHWLHCAVCVWEGMPEMQELAWQEYDEAVRKLAESR